MTIQTFTAGQTLTAAQMNTLQASDFNFTRNVLAGTSYTMVLADKGKLLEFENTGSITLTIPTNAAAAFDIGDRVDVLLASTGTLSIIGDTGVTLNAEGDLTTISSQWTRVTLIKRGTNSWVLTGSGAEVQTVEIEDGAVTEAKLASGAVTSAKIADGAIVNADINASAAIALSKLASGTSGQIVLANASGVPTYTTVSGDITISNTGVAAIAANSVALGTDTTGNYMSDLTQGTGVTITHTPGEGSNATIAIGQSVATSATPTFAGATLDAVQIGVTAANEIDTSSGDLIIDSASGTTSIIDNVAVTGTLAVRAASTQDGIQLQGRAGGTGTFEVTMTPATLTADRTLTLPDASGTIALVGGLGGVTLGTDTNGDYVSSLVAGTGITLTNNSGEGATPTVAIGQSVATSASVTFAQLTTTGNVVVGGDLTVNGTTTTLNTDTLAVEDNIIVLNSNVTNSPSLNAGIEVERGTSTNVLVRWNETNDKWEITNDGTTYGNIVTTSSSTVGATSANTASAVVSRDASGNFVAGKATLSTADVTTVVETASVSATAASGTINIDFSTSPTVYYTSNATANWTFNVRGTSSASLDSVLSTGQIATVTFLATNGATAYRPTVFQVDGVSITPKWMGGTAPSTGNANSIDAYTLAIIKTGSATFVMLASQTRFA